MDIDVDYRRVIQYLSIMDKQLCYPLSESGSAQMFEKRTIARAQEALEQAQEYIGFLYDKYKQMEDEINELRKQRKSTDNLCNNSGELL